MISTVTSAEVKEVFIIPRLSAGAEDDWYPWLHEQLNAAASEDEVEYRVRTLEMPAWNTPVLEKAVAYLQQVLPPSRLHANLYLVGHSIGCLAVLHYLARVAQEHPQAPQIGGVLCVAGWFSIDNPWQNILTWVDAPIDFEAARRLIPDDKLIVLLSDDDPYTSGYHANRQLWVERLQSRVSILPGRQHFSTALDFDVRDAVRDLAGVPTAFWAA